MNKYLILIEEGFEGYGAYAPDLPGCFAVAKTREEVITLIQKAIEIYLESLEQKGKPFPNPSKVKNSIRKTKKELRKLFSTPNLIWVPKSHPYKISYVIPAEEENTEIRKLIEDLNIKESSSQIKSVKPKK